MLSRERIIIDLYFPNFARPSSSRFESLFISLSKIEENKKNDTFYSYLIFPEKIIQGKDKRTSLLIKNIPKIIKKREIRNMVEKYGNINYLILTQDNMAENFLIAYLNVINYRSIVPIYMGLRKTIFYYMNKAFQIEIMYSKIQGKEELKKIFNVKYFG
jgi:hypothetical protein